MKARVAQKTCRNKQCGKKFKPYKSFQVACCNACAMIIQKNHCVTKKRVDIREAPKSRESISSLKKKLQIEINKLVRLIDSGLPCISCPGNNLPQAGHFHSIGAKPFLRFNLNNIHVQDHHCNIELTGNREGYFDGLRDRYGVGYASFVEFVLPEKFRNIKLSTFELLDAIAKAKSSVAELKARTIPIESMQERLKLRLIYNNRIGIYKTF